MFELLFCSILTILPDYLFRRYGQGKRIGKEITLFSVWYELRWGIIACVSADDQPDHRGVLLSSRLHQRDVVLPDGAGAAGNRRAGGRDLCRAERRGGRPASRCSGWTARCRGRRSKRPVSGWPRSRRRSRWPRPIWRRRTAGSPRREGAYEQALEELNTKEELRIRKPDVGFAARDRKAAEPRGRPGWERCRPAKARSNRWK